MNTLKDKKDSKTNLLDIIFNLKFKKSDLKKIDEIRKFAIATKDFETVSISMSLFAYLQYKFKDKNTYRAYAILNDAKYLAVSSNLYLAQKVNMFMFSLLEYEEENFEDALDFIKSAIAVNVHNFDYDSSILNFREKIEKAKQKRIIKLSPPTFIPDNKKNDPLLALLKVGRTIAVETNLDTLLTIIAKEIKLALNADRCTVFLLDKEKNELWSKVALGLNFEEIRFKADLGLAGYSAKTGKTINIKNAYEDKRFNKNIDSKTGYKTKSILCMPIHNMSHEIIGVFQVLNKQNGYFTPKDEDILIAIGSSAGIALENAALFNRQKQLIKQQKDLLSSFIDTLSASIDARDKITSGHSRRVCEYAVLICKKLKMKEDEIEIVRHAALLHDIGKIGIKDYILQKEGKLTKEEYIEIQKHVEITHSILSKIYSSKYFNDVANIASSHHEKYDGTGYFMKLKGEQIPLGGRILAVCDVFDAITSKRHYRQKMSIEDAIQIISDGANTHFDKKITDVFLNINLLEILKVIMNNQQIDEYDSQILDKYRLIDIYTLMKQSSKNYTTQEERLISTFNKYYEFV